MFHKTAPGTFNFKQGQISAPKVKLDKKKAEGPNKKAASAKKAPKKRGTSQVSEASPLATPKRPLRPRQPLSSPGSQKKDYIGCKQKHVKVTESSPKRTRIDPPTRCESDKHDNNNVSESATGKAVPDNAPRPPIGDPVEGEVVPSSVPEADAALGDGDRSLSFPTLTGSLFDEDGDVDRGKPPDVDSQNVECTKNNHDIVPLT